MPEPLVPRSRTTAEALESSTAAKPSEARNVRLIMIFELFDGVRLDGFEFRARANYWHALVSLTFMIVVIIDSQRR